MKASDLFVKCLENEGVEYIFGIPGEEIADFMMSLSEVGDPTLVQRDVEVHADEDALAGDVGIPDGARPVHAQSFCTRSTSREL
jgi:glyoxylate carboligase